MKLYYHKTDGGAEYLTDKWTRNPDGSKEGVFKNARYIIRIDGDIRQDAELSIASTIEKAAHELLKACNLALNDKARQYAGTFDSSMDNDPVVIALRKALAAAM